MTYLSETNLYCTINFGCSLESLEGFRGKKRHLPSRMPGQLNQNPQNKLIEKDNGLVVTREKERRVKWVKGVNVW